MTKTKTRENFQEESFTDGGDHCSDHKEGEGEEAEEDLCAGQMHVGDLFVFVLCQPEKEKSAKLP